MQTLISCSTLECSSPTAPIWQDVLAQAMTGELIAAMNYTSLSEICDDPSEVADALEHAQIERGHAARFAAEGRKIGVDVANNVDAKHWKRLREAFLRVHRRARLYWLPDRAGNHAGIVRGRELCARGQGRAGESGHDLRCHRRRGRRARRSRDGDSSSRASPGRASASTRKSTGCISRS